MGELNSQLQAENAILPTQPHAKTAELTIVLTNWKRPENLPKILDALPPNVKVFLLDNSDFEKRPSEDVLEQVDWYLQSSVNQLWLRWIMASRADTPFFCIHDDDLIVKDWEPYLSVLREGHKQLLGPFGVNFAPNSRKKYTKGIHSDEEGLYDLIKGRLVLGSTGHLRSKPQLLNKLVYADKLTATAEDIAVASTYSDKHLVVKVLENLIELPAPSAASASRAHYRWRDRLARRLFGGVWRRKSRLL